MVRMILVLICVLILFGGCATERQTLLITVTPNTKTAIDEDKDGSSPATIRLTYKLDF